MTVRKVAMLTAGGLAPCLSSAVGGLIERYSEIAPEIELIGYLDGYAGLLTGRATTFGADARADALLLHGVGGSPIGNSRVKLTNVEDCVKRGLVAEGDDPLRVAAEQLTSAGVDVLHTIGGDDTNTMAAALAEYMHNNGYELTVVGLPKTVDNDIVPVRQSLGARTAAEQGALFARNVVAEHTSNPRMLVVHEIMGRHSGWLAAATAREYRSWIAEQAWSPMAGLDARCWDVHALYIPEAGLDLASEAKRLRSTMDELGNVNIFLSEGAGVGEIVAELEAAGEDVPRDPFGHVKLDEVNPGAWFAKQFAGQLGAEKVNVQKSGYFSRSAAAGDYDLRLIKGCADLAVECALAGTSGLIGHDEGNDGRLRAIEFDRVAGGKAFDPTTPWFTEILDAIGQPSQ